MVKNNREYWQKREKEKLNKGIKDCNKLSKELQSQYKKAGKEIEKEINNLFVKYAKENNLTYKEASTYLTSDEFKIWRTDIKGYLEMIKDNPEVLLELNTLAMKSRITRLEALQYEVDKQLNQLTTETEKKTKKLLTQTIKDNYYENIYNISKEKGFLANFSGINNKQIERILSYPWSGSNYSNRIWDNKKQLSKTIKNEITQMIIRGESSNKVAKRIEEKMDSSYKNSIRLVQTEHAYCMNEASKYTYDDLDIDKYEFLATLDIRTCNDCAKLDGKVFNTKDAITGLNYPPMHPNDRCTTVPYYEDDEDDEKDTRFARDEDGKRIEVPANMKYEEWAKKYINKNYENHSNIEEAIKEEFKKKNNVKAPKTNKGSKQKTTKTKTTKKKKEHKKTYKQYDYITAIDIPDENNFLKDITAEERKALKKYTKDDWFEDINDILRGTHLEELTDKEIKAIQKKTKKVIEQISSGLKKGVAHTDMKVFRGTSGSIFNKALDKDLIEQIKDKTMDVKELNKKVKGLVVKDDAFMSTTVAPEGPASEDFNFGIFMEIKIDKGATGGGYIAPISTHSAEREWLLDKGTQLQIENVSWDEGKQSYKLECKYIDPKSLEDE